MLVMRGKRESASADERYTSPLDTQPGGHRRLRSVKREQRSRDEWLGFGNVSGLRPFLALNDLELYLIAFLQALVALT